MLHALVNTTVDASLQEGPLEGYVPTWIQQDKDCPKGRQFGPNQKLYHKLGIPPFK